MRKVYFFSTHANKGSGVSSLICGCVNKRFQGCLPLVCRGRRQLPCPTRDKVSFGEKCSFHRPTLSWHCVEFRVISECDHLRRDPVLASWGGRSTLLGWDVCTPSPVLPSAPPQQNAPPRVLLHPPWLLGPLGTSWEVCIPSCHVSQDPAFAITVIAGPPLSFHIYKLNLQIFAHIILLTLVVRH